MAIKAPNGLVKFSKFIIKSTGVGLLKGPGDNTVVTANLGQYEFADGRLYTGGWQRGHMHGRGKMTWKNGSKYEGMYAVWAFKGARPRPFKRLGRAMFHDEI